MKASRFNGIGEGADDGFLANDLIECLGPEPESNDAGFIHRRGVKVFGLPAGVSISKLLVRLRSSRGTSACCYRCSVPGLAGFAAARLHGFRSLSSNTLTSSVAERVGFEPTVRFPVHSISSAAS